MIGAPYRVDVGFCLFGGVRGSWGLESHGHLVLKLSSVGVRAKD